MLNKKKVAVVIVILLLVIALIVVLIVVNNNDGAKVAKLYDKLESGNEYLFEMKDTNNYTITIAKKDGQTCIDMDNDGERVTTLVKGDTTYLVSHSQKEYYMYNNDIAGETIVTDMLKDIGEPNEKGKEKINGRDYKYEQYNGFAGFMTSTNIDINENNIKTRFYFNGDDLVYIKTLLDNGEEELLSVTISYKVNDELFEIPSDYAETNY